jgi:protein-disulfide isomerase
MILVKKDIKFNTGSSSAFLTTIIAILILTGSYAQGQEMPFPTYGLGAVQVCIYTDYFCPPCRGMEPAVEPLLRDLIKRNVIRVTLVDMPFSKYSPLYASYFLYALKTKNDLEYALKVRNILFDAAAKNDVTTKEGIPPLNPSLHLTGTTP